MRRESCRQSEFGAGSSIHPCPDASFDHIMVVLTGGTMKANIHPKYVEAVVKCGCGETFKTRSTKPEIHLEICSKCHPFYTGKQRLVDTAGRVEKFQRKYSKISKN